MMMMMETLKALVTSVKKRMLQKLKSLLWSSVTIVTSTSLSSADIFTSSSDLNSLLYNDDGNSQSIGHIRKLCLEKTNVKYTLSHIVQAGTAWQGKAFQLMYCTTESLNLMARKIYLLKTRMLMLLLLLMTIIKISVFVTSVS